MENKKFIIVYQPKDVETLVRNDFKLVGSYMNTTQNRVEYMFINKPDILLTFDLSNMKLAFSDQLMF